MRKDKNGSPGSHPHANQANWRPAEVFDDYIRNCLDGLESYSDRRAAKLLGVSRAELWRWRLMAELPADLFDRLLKARPMPSTRSLAAIALALKGDEKSIVETECCPCCGHVLRVRRRINSAYVKIVDEWLRGEARFG
jgi:hypothetical protein